MAQGCEGGGGATVFHNFCLMVPRPSYFSTIWWDRDGLKNSTLNAEGSTEQGMREGYNMAACNWRIPAKANAIGFGKGAGDWLLQGRVRETQKYAGILATNVYRYQMQPGILCTCRATQHRYNRGSKNNCQSCIWKLNFT